MFRYQINGETVVFKNEIERDAGLAKADEMGYFVQMMAPEEAAPESAFSEVIQGNVPE